jgi:hypothetical protein
MARHGRFVYTPRAKGWIAVRDMLGQLVEFIDCKSGGAQQRYERRCCELEAEGWTLELRFADSRFVSRGGERRKIAIVPDDPRKHPGLGPGV